MFEVGFTEMLLIAVLALVVLGPERLPRVAAQLGRWVGRARAMARQFREQLEEEAILEPTPRRTRPAAESATPNTTTPPPEVVASEAPPVSSADETIVSNDSGHADLSDSPATDSTVSAAASQSHERGT